MWLSVSSIETSFRYVSFSMSSRSCWVFLRFSWIAANPSISPRWTSRSASLVNAFRFSSATTLLMRVRYLLISALMVPISSSRAARAEVMCSARALSPFRDPSNTPKPEDSSTPRSPMACLLAISSSARAPKVLLALAPLKSFLHAVSSSVFALMSC